MVFQLHAGLNEFYKIDLSVVREYPITHKNTIRILLLFVAACTLMLDWPNLVDWDSLNTHYSLQIVSPILLMMHH